MEIEVALRKWDVDVAAFADRFAVVECFKHGKEAAVFLHKPRKGVKDARPAMPA